MDAVVPIHSRVPIRSDEVLGMAGTIDYRKLALEHYPKPHMCAHCGFGIRDVLEVAHIDGNRSNNKLANLVILCPNCHKMYDLDLISKKVIVEMRDRPKKVDWANRMKDAGQKAKETRARNAANRRRKNSARAKKAWESRHDKQAAS